MYEFNKAKYEKKPPQNLNKLSVINRSHIPQNIAKTVEYTTTSTSGWSFGVGIGIGQCLKSLGWEEGIFARVSYEQKSARREEIFLKSQNCLLESDCGY